MINVIKGKIKDLNKMHDKHINTPDFDEQAEEERAIEILTSEITSVRRRRLALCWLSLWSFMHGEPED